MKKSATVTSIAFLGFALGAFFESMKLPFGRVGLPAAGFFPAVLAALLAIVSLLTFVDGLRAGKEDAAPAERLTWKKIVLIVGSLLAFAFLFESCGYLVMTFLFVGFLLRAVERTSWRLAVSVGLSASVVSYVIFGLVLGAPLPAGFLKL